LPGRRVAAMRAGISTKVRVWFIGVAVWTELKRSGYDGG
jgi:hypothetical protein